MWTLLKVGVAADKSYFESLIKVAKVSLKVEKVAFLSLKTVSLTEKNGRFNQKRITAIKFGCGNENL